MKPYIFYFQQNKQWVINNLLINPKKKSIKIDGFFVCEIHDYFTPCIILTKILFRAIISNPHTITKTEIYVNKLPAPRLSTFDEIIPPNKFAKNDANNQTPISKDANRGGESLVTTDKPTGDKQSSPMVCTK